MLTSICRRAAWPSVDSTSARTAAIHAAADVHAGTFAYAPAGTGSDHDAGAFSLSGALDASNPGSVGPLEEFANLRKYARVLRVGGVARSTDVVMMNLPSSACLWTWRSSGPEKPVLRIDPP